MKLMPRCLATVAVGLGLVGLLGCQEDNEKSATITSAPPAAGSAAPARSQADYGKQIQSSNLKTQGYPGAAR